jgi:hypothetical protein
MTLRPMARRGAAEPLRPGAPRRLQLRAMCWQPRCRAPEGRLLERPDRRVVQRLAWRPNRTLF